MLEPMATQKDEAPLWAKERTQVLDAAKAVYREGLVVATSGNVSVRLHDQAGRDLMAVTASSVAYQEMALDDVVVVDFEGDPVLGDAIPSTETLMHSAIYQARPDVSAVVHTHSVYASALAVAGVPVPALIDEMVVHLGGSIQVAEYAFPGTEELAEHVVSALGERNAVLLRNHGLVGVGGSVAEALRVCQLAERMAHIYLLTTLLGAGDPLPDEIVDAELELFRMRQQSKIKDLG